MHPMRHHSASCPASNEDALLRFLDEPESDLDAIDCPACRDEVSAIQHLDRVLADTLRTSAASVPSLPERRLAATLEQLRGEPCEIRVSRRLRRGLRVVLWSALYGFLLLGASALLVALFRVVSARLPLE